MDSKTARSLHYSIMGYKSLDIDQRESFHCLGRNVQFQISVREDSTVVERLWQDVYLPQRLQYTDSYLHG